MAGPTSIEAHPRDGLLPSGPSAVGRRRRTALVLLIAVAVLTAAATWLLYGSSWLRVTAVQVTGTRVLTPDQVRRAADVRLGGPLVSIDTDAVAQRLRTRLRPIAAVEVSRSWPHTLTLRVTERIPSALIESGAKFIEVDADGVRYATVSASGVPKGVPLVKLAAQQSVSLRFFGAKRLLQAAVVVAGDLPAAVHRDARVIRVRGYDSITVELTGGRTVMWGSEEQGARKAQVLTALMKAAKSASHFDVSAPTAPSVSGG